MGLIVGNAAMVAAAKLDFALDWAAQLGGDPIASASWPAVSGLTQIAASNTTTTTTVRYTGGAAGTRYQPRCHIVRSSGQEDERAFELSIVERIVVLELELAYGAIRDIGPIDWTAYLGGDAISTHAWTATGLTIVGSTTGATVRVSATASGVFYATDHSVTASGQEDERSILLAVQAL